MSIADQNADMLSCCRRTIQTRNILGRVPFAVVDTEHPNCEMTVVIEVTFFGRTVPSRPAHVLSLTHTPLDHEYPCRFASRRARSPWQPALTLDR